MSALSSAVDSESSKRQWAKLLFVYGTHKWNMLYTLFTRAIVCEFCNLVYVDCSLALDVIGFNWAFLSFLLDSVVNCWIKKIIARKVRWKYSKHERVYACRYVWVWVCEFNGAERRAIEYCQMYLCVVHARLHVCFYLKQGIKSFLSTYCMHTLNAHMQLKIVARHTIFSPSQFTHTQTHGFNLDFVREKRQHGRTLQEREKWKCMAKKSNK